MDRRWMTDSHQVTQLQGPRKTVCSRWRSARLVDHSSLVCPACLLAWFENFLCVLDGVNSGREGRVEYNMMYICWEGVSLGACNNTKKSSCREKLNFVEKNMVATETQSTDGHITIVSPLDWMQQPS